jgi:hypothetical protein
LTVIAQDIADKSQDVSENNDFSMNLAEAFAWLSFMLTLSLRLARDCRGGDSEMASVMGKRAWRKFLFT